ncbi:MAG: S41 family peptidase, partial [Acidobacteriota bacterium]
MQKIFRLSLIPCLIIALTGSAISQSTTKPIAKTARTVSAKPATSAVNDELLALLPASDALAVVDINRLFNQLLPSLANLQTGGLEKMGKELAEFAQKTGIDPAKVNRAVVGLLAKNPTGLIVDMRNNPGGLLDRAVTVAGEWTGP